MDPALVNQLKRIAIIALASDDELIETIVLKGGNAIDLAYQGNEKNVSRTSYDLDFSIEGGDFTEDESAISERIKLTLEKTFLEYGYVVMDYKFVSRPSKVRPEVADFWGGYLCTFKILGKKKYDELKESPEKQLRNAIPLKNNTSPLFEIEFSKFEYVGAKAPVKVENFTVYVYTPEMIVFEKLRAICQQLPDYKNIIPSHSSRARARDFYDIHLIMEMHDIDPITPENKEMIRHVFEAKKVPLEFIKEIGKHASIHRDNWKEVEATVTAGEDLKPFYFYCDYVVGKFNDLTFL